MLNYYGNGIYYGTGHFYGDTTSTYTPETMTSPVFFLEYSVGSGSYGSGSFGDYSPGLGVTYSQESPGSVVYTKE